MFADKLSKNVPPLENIFSCSKAEYTYAWREKKGNIKSDYYKYIKIKLIDV